MIPRHLEALASRARRAGLGVVGTRFVPATRPSQPTRVARLSEARSLSLTGRAFARHHPGGQRMTAAKQVQVDVEDLWPASAPVLITVR